MPDTADSTTTTAVDSGRPNLVVPEAVDIVKAPEGRALAAATSHGAPAAMIDQPKRGRTRFILPVIALAAMGAGGWYGWDWYAGGRFIVSTDDAYVRADMAIIAPKISGYVLSVAVQDNASVKAGDILAHIDDADYRLAVEAAQRKIETQDSTIARIRAQAGAQGAVIEQMQAQIAAAHADQQRAASEYERASKLMHNAVGTQQRLDLALADRDRTNAAVQNAEAARQAAQANLLVLDAQRSEAEHTRRELMTALDKARRDLSFTEIRAPFDGVVGNRAVQTGQFVQPGTRLLALIPTTSAYIEANFKETQISRMKPGQKVAIHIDALSGQIINGTVEQTV